jgi:hypothetical protein
VIVLLWACGTPTQPASDDRPRHATEWDSLTKAAEQGDVQTVQMLARDFELGDVPDHPSASQLGAALGFLQMAEDPEELKEGLAKAQEACEACHNAQGSLKVR